MKETKDQILCRAARLDIEATLLRYAVSALLAGDVIWFRKGPVRLGILHATRAHGGVVIYRHGGDFVGAYYWEKWYQEVQTNATLTQSEEAIQLRECAFLAARFVADQQKSLRT